MKNNYKVYYATEENCFEGEKLAENVSRDTAKEILDSNIVDDVEYGGERDSLVAEVMSSGWVLFENTHGYEVLYIVTTNGREARSIINGLRKNILG